MPVVLCHLQKWALAWKQCYIWLEANCESRLRPDCFIDGSVCRQLTPYQQQPLRIHYGAPPAPPPPSYHTADWYQRDGPTRKNQFEGMRALVELSAWEWMMLGWLSIQPVIGWTRRWRRPLHLRVRTLEQAEFTDNGVTQHPYVGYSPLSLSWIMKSFIMLYAWVLPNMQDSLILHISVSVEVAIWN